jgi:glycosyltransferase involved in cell wall biosynthesis
MVRRRRIVVVGSGTRFLSGISVYTVRLANALSDRHRVALITMRRLLPARLYPGWKRVGADLTRLERDPAVSLFDGVDWYWWPSIIRGAIFLLRHRPQAVVFQWWTGTVLHSYIALALLARLLGARIIVEFHEIIETGEANIPFAAGYVRAVAPILMRLADGFAVHSEFDRRLVLDTWSVGRRPIAVLPHGPHDHYQSRPGRVERLREAPEGTCNLLFFGVIRPYKGLEHLVTAFEAIPDAEIERYWLTVVGETWEGWTLPTEMIERSRRRERITLVNRYVEDHELHGYLRGADAVVLPYLRSSLSGPLHVAMGYGLPVVMTDVGGNAEAARGYDGVVLVPPGEPRALTEALRRVTALAGVAYTHPHSWGHTAEAYEGLFDELDQLGRGASLPVRNGKHN